MLDEIVKGITIDKRGVEIGGPSSETGRVVYENSLQVDNVIFSKETNWSSHTDTYNYFPGKQGKVILSDAVSIPQIANESYDYVFSSHSLEHIANPLKAMKEWVRITKSKGYILLILPEKTYCFDHRRNISTFTTLLSQYEKGVGEDDLSTLPEILEKHDLSMDGPAGTFEQFKLRSLDNFKNRCLHHYVYSTELLRQICYWSGCEFVFTVTNGLNIWYIMKKV